MMKKQILVKVPAMILNIPVIVADDGELAMHIQIPEEAEQDWARNPNYIWGEDEGLLALSEKWKNGKDAKHYYSGARPLQEPRPVDPPGPPVDPPGPPE